MLEKHWLISLQKDCIASHVQNKTQKLLEIVSLITRTCLQ